MYRVAFIGLLNWAVAERLFGEAECGRGLFR